VAFVFHRDILGSKGVAPPTSVQVRENYSEALFLLRVSSSLDSVLQRDGMTARVYPHFSSLVRRGLRGGQIPSILPLRGNSGIVIQRSEGVALPTSVQVREILSIVSFGNVKYYLPDLKMEAFPYGIFTNIFASYV
jgi:hypothetical protein